MKENIDKYLKGELGKEEALKVINAINTNKVYLDYYITAKTEKTLLEISQEDRKSYALIAYKEFNKTYIYKRKQNKRFFFRAAAAALILIFISSYFVDKHLNSQFTEVVTINNEPHKSITLNDGSTVILSANSKLSYNNFSKSSIRSINLEGEAFFNVTKNINKPFIVTANGLDIKVLGTTFNVKAEANTTEIETILFTGKVNLIKDKVILSSLAPNQHAIYNTKNKKLIVKNLENTSQLLENKQGLLVFENTPLNIVLLKLEQRYHKTFVINIEDLKKHHFTGKFNPTQTMAEIVTILNTTTSIKFSIKNNHILLENK